MSNSYPFFYRSLLYKIVSKVAKTTGIFHYKKNGHGTPRYDPTKTQRLSPGLIDALDLVS